MVVGSVYRVGSLAASLRIVVRNKHMYVHSRKTWCLRNQTLETQRWIWAGIVRNQPQFLHFTARRQSKTLYTNRLAGCDVRNRAGF